MLQETIFNTSHKNQYFLQKPEIEVIATINNNKQLILFCRSLYDSSIDFRETAFALFFKDNDCIGVLQAGSGNKNECVIDCDSILRTAILLDSENVIFCHNHPSGSVKQSKSDLKVDKLLTRKLNVVNIGYHYSIVLSGVNNNYGIYEM